MFNILFYQTLYIVSIDRQSIMGILARAPSAQSDRLLAAERSVVYLKPMQI